MDANHDRYITAEELAAGLRAHGKEVKEETLERIVRHMDHDGDGRLSTQEFDKAFIGPC